MARLIYVMGPSGAGKDTVLGLARTQAPQTLWFAHRYITRPAGHGSENHVALSEDEFAARLAAGGFALAWRSHGFFYGIGCEIDQWLAVGLTVVVSGSRESFADATGRYPGLLPVLITAAPDTVRRRLLARGREDAAGIADRLRHNAAVAVSHPDLRVIENDGAPAEAAARFLALALES